MASNPTIVGTGFLALDLVISADPATPIRTWAGGSCGNVLAILAWHGWNSYPVARLDDGPAAERVSADLSRWGAKLDYLRCEPQVSTPMIVQQIRQTKSGQPKHSFSWTCPSCGHWLPSFKPITKGIAQSVVEHVSAASVFFFDRVSRGTLELAEAARTSGALVVFEPSGRSDAKLFADALRIAHVIKYSTDRLKDLEISASPESPWLEIRTMGSVGLQFRDLRAGCDSDWVALPAVAASSVVDSCGAGDWCTAGFIVGLGGQGAKGLASAPLESIIDALAYGQRLAAWNCGFEGARGGMYAPARWPERLSTTASTMSKADFGDVSDVDGVVCPSCSLV